MEASPFSFTPERYWTEEKERALIAFFSKHSCLWNHKSESYKNRQLRWKTLERLRILLSAHPPPVPFTVEDIKNKFKNLRTTFQRQYKMVKASRVCRSEDVFVPQWKHYQQLMFLQGCWDQDDGVDDQPLSPLTLPQEENQSVLTSQGLIISFLPSPSTSFPSTSTSSVPSNMMVKCYWTEERERALIAFYSEHSCLWNKKSENHNNRQLRLRLLEALRAQLSDHSVLFSVQSDNRLSSDPCYWSEAKVQQLISFYLQVVSPLTLTERSDGNMKTGAKLGPTTSEMLDHEDALSKSNVSRIGFLKHGRSV
ncbi:uncharacterized protein AKAME5_000906400 [Lates japonicus]|uniref:MADF domain-containing protein n=1 Tax=Lates japonicus TaxID=270547 RepID=A0AAD3ML78_LATJO|nr:uncharacterized protein AKAME5_000906400 [Lates japonicus]